GYSMLRFGWSDATVGASLATAGIVMALSQALLTRRLIPRIGERRAALLGIAVACTGYFGYGAATQSWMMFAWLATWFFGALVMPSTNALLSHRVPPDAQGELQGAVACLFSLASIVGPLLLPQIFSHFTSGRGPYVPGASFLFAGLLAFTCWFVYRATTRESAIAAAPNLQGNAA